MLAVFSRNDKAQRMLSIPKLWLPVGEYPSVKRGSETWYGIKYPDPTIGGRIYVRLEHLPLADKPCKCSRLRFPHKRNASCKGGSSG